MDTRTEKSGALATALKSRFGLSEAEAQIALALAGGSDLARIGQLRGVTRHTVRSQLKSIFHKTGARSQSQLVALILRSDWHA